VADWNQWVEVIRTTAPSTLVILPHHEYRGGFEYLQLGAETTGDRDGHPGYLKSLLVKMKHVKSRAQDPGPVVLLLGCETQVARISFESFVSRFRTAGAAVVIATLATVLGRDAGPVAKVLLDELSGATEQRRTIGDVVLSAKRKLLLRGIPMALGITTYGGADRPLQR
jgi:hypothetical protein